MGKRSLYMAVKLMVEIPKGSRNKYEYDARTGRIRFDRVLFSASRRAHVVSE